MSICYENQTYFVIENNLFKNSLMKQITNKQNNYKILLFSDNTLNELNDNNHNHNESLLHILKLIKYYSTHEIFILISSLKSQIKNELLWSFIKNNNNKNNFHFIVVNNEYTNIITNKYFSNYQNNYLNKLFYGFDKFSNHTSIYKQMLSDL